MKEMLDIYDDKLKKIGVRSREEVHKLGLKHRVVQCYIIKKNEDEECVYFQQRSYDKDTCPGMYDIACAGHVDAGEEFLYSMKRELSEEVGILAEDDELKYAGIKFEFYKKGQSIDDEICEMFILKIHNDDELKINEELLDIVKAPLHIYEKWTKGSINVLNAVSLKDNTTIELNKENSCPHIFEYNEELINKMMNF